jgi:hypothetical protein
MSHMILSDGVAYVEAHEPPINTSVLSSLCIGCEFINSDSKCDEAFEKSPRAFDGNCRKRRVIYIKADPQPKND